MRDVLVGIPAGPLTALETERCGDDCVRATTTLGRGHVAVVVRVAFAGRTDTARFRFPWPLPPDASALLDRAEARSACRKAEPVTQRERRGAESPAPEGSSPAA